MYVYFAVRILYLLSEHNDLGDHQVMGQPENCQGHKPIWRAKMSPEWSQILCHSSQISTRQTFHRKPSANFT